jgi:hypothetical protein
MVEITPTQRSADTLWFSVTDADQVEQVSAVATTPVLAYAVTREAAPPMKIAPPMTIKLAAPVRSLRVWV